MSEPPDPRVREALRTAIARFNAGDWHEALDGFEVLLHEDAPERRELWLGLVRVSAALYHFAGGRPTSARKLYASGRALLAPRAPETEGIDVAALLADLDAAFTPLLAASVPGTADALRPAVRPQIGRSIAW